MWTLGVVHVCLKSRGWSGSGEVGGGAAAAAAARQRCNNIGFSLASWLHITYAGVRYNPYAPNILIVKNRSKAQ